MRLFARAAAAVTASLGLAFVFLLGGASAASADVDDFSFDSLSVDYFLERDADGVGRMRVVEEFTAVFPETDQNRGIRRLIPSRYQGQPLSPEVLSVTDGDGRQRPMEVEEDDDVVSITSRADEYLHGRQVFVITYELENVTRVFEDTGTELYWNVNGIEWAQSFGVVDARSEERRVGKEC